MFNRKLFRHKCLFYAVKQWLNFNRWKLSLVHHTVVKNIPVPVHVPLFLYVLLFLDLKNRVQEHLKNTQYEL